MSELAPTPTEIKRTTQVLQVMQLTFEDPQKKIEDACEEVGIAPRTYYYWVKRDPDALRAVREFLAETQKVELSFLSAAVTKINMQLANVALNNETEPADRLKIAKYLSAEAEKLQRTYQVTAGSEDAAEFLKEGPQLTKQTSRFASMQVTSEDNGSLKVDFYRSDDVIDVPDLDEIDPLDEPE